MHTCTLTVAVAAAERELEEVRLRQSRQVEAIEEISMTEKMFKGHVV